MHDVVRRRLVIQGIHDPQSTQGKETEPDQEERDDIAASEGAKHGKDETGNKGYKDPRAGDFVRVPEADASDQEEKKDG
jgi:hypothetical protein